MLPWAYLLHVLGGREEHRRLGQILHAIELGAICDGMIELVQLLASRSGHFALGSASLLIARLAFRTLYGKSEKEREEREREMALVEISFNSLLS